MEHISIDIYVFLDPSKGKPYYFGTTNIFCTIKKTRRKRSSPSSYTLSLKQRRWILYDGVYFERFRKNDTATYGHSTDMDSCKTKRERSPAEYSNLSVDCLKRCTERYRQLYGRYHLLTNNCHHFADKCLPYCATQSALPGVHKY